MEGATVYGIKGQETAHQRVPTICFNLKDISPATLATKMAENGIALRNGHMYSPRLMKRLGISPDGAVRASLVHYNSHQEIRLFLSKLREIAGS